MHVPKPLGGYPLVLRDIDVTNPHIGELLLDYKTNDLYYVNKSKEVKSISKDIFDKLISVKLENPDIVIAKDKNDSPGVSSDIQLIPPIDKRPMNSWYMNITKAEPINIDEK